MVNLFNFIFNKYVAIFNNQIYRTEFNKPLKVVNILNKKRKYTNKINKKAKLIL